MNDYKHDYEMKSEITSTIKHKLQYPKIVLEMMAEKNVNRNNVPIEFIEDGLKAIKQIYRLVNKLERMTGKGG